MQCVVLIYHHNPVLSYLPLGLQQCIVLRSLARLVKYGPVEMAISFAVEMSADILDILDISFVPVRMALCADFYHSVSPCIVAL
jgi:hypothetical protein